ncbi:MAG: chloride channel protein [Phycisphaerales bacterium]|nr:chloride channel protein [Phycisphaerales bacterium]
MAHQLGLRRDWHLVVIAVFIGLLMAVVATMFIAPLHMAEGLGESLAQKPWFWALILFAPAVGGLLVGICRWIIHASHIGPGISTIIYSVRRKRGKINWRLGVQQWINSSISIASGGSAGAEGPIASIGGVMGSNAGQLMHANTQATTTLLGCGAAAGISAVFNAPIAGIFFVMEIMLRDFSMRTFTPIVISSVVAAAATQGILHDEAIFNLGEAFADQEGHFHISILPLYLLLGVLCGLGGLAFIKGLSATGTFFEKLKFPYLLKPALGGLMLGVLGLGTIMIAGIEGVPDFYGNGYPVITNFLQPSTYVSAETGDLIDGSGLLAIVLLGTFALKLAGTCLTLGSGGAGGMFAPSLLLGASIGGAVGIGVDAMGWLPHGTPAQFALVGMAAVVAATTHAPLTAILIVYELTRSYEVILPLMFAAVVSTLLARWLCRDNIYSSKLRAAGLRSGSMSDLTILRKLTVSDLTLEPAVCVSSTDSVGSMLRHVERQGTQDFVVTDEKGNYAGLVTAGDLKAALIYREAIPLLQVNELQRTKLPVIDAEETLDMVLEKFSQCDADSLAVLDNSHQHATGMVTRSQLMRRYQAALDRDE